MINLRVDSTSAKAFDGCNTCCCEQVLIKRMGSEQIAVDFSPWCLPVAPRGLTRTKIHAKPMNDPDRSSDLIIETATIWDGKNDIIVSDYSKDGQRFHFEYLPQYRTRSTITNDGLLSFLDSPEYFYSKNLDWQDHAEYLACWVSKGEPAPPYEYVRYSTTTLADNTTLLLNLMLTPFARVGHVLRLDISQYAEDCDCVTYERSFCIDINVVSC